LGQEVETIGENMLSVIHNQAKTFGEVQAQAANLTSAINTTRTTVLAAAGGIPRIVSCMLPCWQNPGVTWSSKACMCSTGPHDDLVS
jgi:hypothetical protein